MIINILLLLLFFIPPFGELLRYTFNNGVVLTALDLIAGCILLFGIFQWRKNKHYIHTKLTKPIGLFIGICFLSLLINIPQLQPSQLFVSSLYLFRWIALTSIYFFIVNQPEENKKRLPKLMMFSGGLFLLFGFLQYIFFNDLRPFIFLGWDEHYLRLFSTFLDPNFAGIFLVFYFLFMLHLFFKQKSKPYGYAALAFLSCIAIFLTLSRSAFIALLVGLFTYLLLQKNKKYFYLFGIILALLIGSILLLGNLPTEGAHIFRIPSSQARIGSFTNAITIFSDNPLFGVGFNAYRYAQNKHGFLDQKTWESSHAAAGADNSLLFVLATIGIVGFFVYCHLLYRMSKISVSTPVVFASLIALICSSMFVNALFYTPLLVWMWILFGFTENT